jgi:type IV pilus assembly protein PilQ
MKALRVWGALCAAALIPCLATAADAANITGIKIVEGGGKRQLVVELNGTGPRAQVITTLRDKAWVAELRDTQLRIGPNPDGSYRLERPAQSLDILEATQVDAQTVRLRLVGVDQAPGVIPGESTATRLVFDLGAPLVDPVLKTSVSSRTGIPDSNPEGEATRRFNVRAVAPPTGDIAIGEITVGPSIELGANDKVTLVLKDAPVREVLQILARRAGLNILFSSEVGTQRVSMDVQGEGLGDTFNFVLRLNGLKGRRVGKTVLVGANIAQDLLQTQIRTFRVNQTDVNQVAGVLRGLGAQVTGASAAGVGATGGATGGAAGGLGGSIGQGPLQGELFVSIDARTNSLTVIGTPRALQITQAEIAQLDVRQRQVMIDVKLVDINLNTVTDLGFRFGGSSGNFSLGSLSNGFVGAGFGGTPGVSSPTIGPGANQGTITGTGSTPNGTFLFSTLNSLVNAIAFRIDAAIQEGSAKVLAAPKIVLQSGESFTKPNTAKLDITDDVIVGTTINVDPATGLTTSTVKIDKVGVILNISVFNIDDNGYVNVLLKPEVSSINDQTRDANGNLVTLLTRRNLDIQRLRLRDGQTFVLGGVIREVDRNLVQKIPILGDLPILGSLFRTTSAQNERREVALMVTPHILKDPGEEIPTPVSGTPVSTEPTTTKSVSWVPPTK